MSFRESEVRIRWKNMSKQTAGIAFSCAIALAFSGWASTSDPMVTKERRSKNEAAIQELIDGFVKAIRAKDINGVMSAFAPEVVSFDLTPPLQHGGGEPLVRPW